MRTEGCFNLVQSLYPAKQRAERAEGAGSNVRVYKELLLLGIVEEVEVDELLDLRRHILAHLTASQQSMANQDL